MFKDYLLCFLRETIFVVAKIASVDNNATTKMILFCAPVDGFATVCDEDDCVVPFLL